MSEDTSASQIAIGNYIAQALGEGAQAIVQVSHVHETPEVPIPLQRPARSEHFIGRQAELSHLLSNLKPGKVVTLCGAGGIGKSALAAEAIWRLASDDAPPQIFPDGIIFHSFYNYPEVDIALEHIVRTFGEEPQPTPTAAALRVLSNRCVLLVLDGTENADNLPAILAIRGRSGILVTTRSRQDAVDGWNDVSSLCLTDAVKLLKAWGKDWVEDDTIAEQICELVGRLPLAVRLVGRFMAQAEENGKAYLAWLKETPLQALDQGRRQLDSVTVLMERSLSQIGDISRQSLSVIGLLALNSFDESVISEALQISKSATKQILKELVNYGLLLRTDTKRFEVTHALIHTYARQRLETPNQVIHQLVNFFANFVEKQRELGTAGYTELDKERSHLLSLTEKCTERENWEAVYTLVLSVKNYLDIQGYWTERIIVLELGLKAVRALGRYQDEIAFLNNLGKTYRYVGEETQGIKYYKQALAVAEKTNDLNGEAKSLGGLGNAFGFLGETDKAIEYRRSSLNIRKQLGDKKGQAITLNNLGLAYNTLGDYQSAIECYKQSLEIKRSINYKEGEARSFNNLGLAYNNMGDFNRAIKYHRQSLDLYREFGDKKGEAFSLNKIGVVYRYLGDLYQAVIYSELALEISKSIGHKANEARCLTNIGNALRMLGQVEEALEYQKQALKIRREIGSQHGEAINLNDLGICYREKGDLRHAFDNHEQALKIARRVGAKRTEGNTLGNLGAVFWGLGEITRAIAHFESALKISREINDKYNEGNWLENLGRVYGSSGDIPKAKQYLEDALIIFNEIQLSQHAVSIRQELSNFED